MIVSQKHEKRCCTKCAAPLPAGRKHTYCTDCLREYRVGWNEKRALRLHRRTIERARARMEEAA